MNYIIYGVNRVAKDFLYIFDNLNVLYFIEDGITSNTFLNYPVKSLEEALILNNFDKIIVCDFDKSDRRNALESKGLKYPEDFLYECDFFPQLDAEIIPKGRKIAVWGTGNMADKLMRESVDFTPDIFIDSFKNKDEFYGRKVFSPNDIDIKDYFVVVSVAKSMDIVDYLEDIGMESGKDFCSFQMVLGRPSALLAKTIFDRSYCELECHTMLNHLEILNNGETRCCCTTFVSQSLDDAISKNMDELWNSNIHKVMCLSIENRTYSFCDKDMCPLFVDKSKIKKYSRNMKEWDYKKMTGQPEIIALGYDPSCNLACATCRKCTYFVKGEDKKRVDRITEIVKADYLKGCRFLIMAGDGEVFASLAYRDIYEDERCNPEYIRLLTNGTLFNKQNWERFIKGKTSKVMLTVSVDAASKDTYERIRRNGNFDILRENMEFAAHLRKSGQLKYFRMNFVVQRENYREMPEFVKWGSALGVDEIFFTKIINWGTFSADEFQNVSMMEEDGITPQKELKEVLENPIIKNSSLVDLGTIQYAHKVDEIGKVDNYYIWELEKRGGKLPCNL